MWVGGGKQDKFRRLLVSTVQVAEYGELEKVNKLNKREDGSTVQQLNTRSQQWVGGSKADQYGELVEVQQLNKGEAGSTAAKYGEPAVGWWKYSS